MTDSARDGADGGNLWCAWRIRRWLRSEVRSRVPLATVAGDGGRNGGDHDGGRSPTLKVRVGLRATKDTVTPTVRWNGNQRRRRQDTETVILRLLLCAISDVTDGGDGPPG